MSTPDTQSKSSIGARQITPVEIKLQAASTHHSVESRSTEDAVEGNADLTTAVESNLDSSAMESSNNSSPLSGASSNFCYDTNVLLAHKAYVMKKFPEPQDQNGYPPVYMLDCETCKKKIGYKDKRIPRFMRDGQEGILSRDCSLSSIPGNEFSTRSIPTQRSVPREMSRRQKMADRIAARDSSKIFPLAAVLGTRRRKG